MPARSLKASISLRVMTPGALPPATGVPFVLLKSRPRVEPFKVARDVRQIERQLELNLLRKNERHTEADVGNAEGVAGQVFERAQKQRDGVVCTSAFGLVRLEKQLG